MTQNNGASPVGDRAVVPSASSPQAVSPVPASIPSAGMFGVIDGWRFEVVEISKVTEQCFWHASGWRNKDTRAYLDKLVCFGVGRDAMELAAASLTSARDERNRRERAVRVWYSKEVEKIAASAMSARSGETEGLAPEAASAVPKADAQSIPEDSAS